ncbi:YciI family protein [Bordetella genomosp. 13]|uniref:YciI family protein n=1 Tax=Bordetella genomosp. 13 TaxID=463040 RepID=UPI0011A19DE8|nr:YciI family protein [Bordetella genomosp. 13]
MRYMIIVKASADSEAGALPGEPLLAAMAAYHDELARAGVLLDAAGLRSSAEGWRVQYDGEDRRRVTDGPFAEGEDLIAGYTLIQVRTREEALEWSKRYPNPRGPGRPCAIEVRRVGELEDFMPGPAMEHFHQATSPRA